MLNMSNLFSHLYPTHIIRISSVSVEQFSPCVSSMKPLTAQVPSYYKL